MPATSTPPLHRLLRQPDVCDVTGLSPTTIWRYERAGKFPRRRKIVGNLVGWRSDEVATWVEERPAVSPDEEAAA